jgi:2-phospho-L-lactate/phosphoenolpyruvate guanylyltransferase
MTASQMRTIAILPVKSFNAAKQRLAGLLGAGSRQALAQAMFSDVLTSLRHVPGLDAVAVVTSDRVAESAALGERVQVLRDTEQAGQSEATLIGIRYAQAADYERVLLVPGDTPLVDSRDVGRLLALDAPVAIVPDRRGTGTNALLLTPPDAITPSFGPGSFARHVAAAHEAGVEHAVERIAGLMFDIDTPDDLADLSTALDERRGHAPSTRGALRQLDRSRARASAPRVAPASA